MVGGYTGLFDATRRFGIHQNVMIIYHMILMVVLYFHFYNICGFTSSVSCMSHEIVESVMKNNGTYRDQKLTPHDVNMTHFMENDADMLVFRVVSSDPSQGTSSSRFNYKAVYLSPKGDVVQYRGSTEELKEHDQKRM